MRRRVLRAALIRGIALLILVALTLSGCASGKAPVTEESDVPPEYPGNSTAADPTGDEEAPDETMTVSVGGPYGTLSVSVPENWTAEAAPVDSGKLLSGLYGLILTPESAGGGHIELFCHDNFAVCGTGLTSTEITLAGGKARVGAYEGNDHWDFITFGFDRPGIVALQTDCLQWPDRLWDEALSILDTMKFDQGVTEGGCGQMTPESEDTDLAVIIEVDHVTPTGLTVHLRQYERKDDIGELEYGESYKIEVLKDGSWEEVPAVSENTGFTDIAYILPQETMATLEINWEWLYGKLPAGTYRITKWITDGNDRTDPPHTGIPLHPVTAQFIIAGE